MTENVREMVESVEKVLDDPELSMKVVRQLLDDHGGMQVYLPLAESAFRLEDEAQIYDEFDGANIKEICRKWKKSFTTVYQILEREKERRRIEAVKSTQKSFDFE